MADNEGDSRILPMIAFFGIIGAALFFTLGLPERKPYIDLRADKIGNFALKSASFGGEPLLRDTTKLSEVLAALKKARYLGAKGNEFTVCDVTLSLEYENGKREIIEFYKRPPSIKECALAKSSYSYHYYEAYELLNTVHST